jgi:hypothetical protein
MLRSAEQREGEEREAQHDVTRRHVISWALDLVHENTDNEPNVKFRGFPL